jgi:hypothetical protein
MRSPLPVLLLILLCGCGLHFDPTLGAASAEVGRSETAPAPIPEVMMGALQEDLDLNPVQAAAILGNLAQETGNFTLLKQINGSAIGYSQWMGPRRRAFMSFAEQNGGAFSHEANYGFLVEELLTQYEGTLERIRSTDRVEEATRIFMREFLRPSPKHANLPRRVQFAERFLAEEFAGAGCVGPGPVQAGRVPTCPAVAETTPITPDEADAHVLIADMEQEKVSPTQNETDSPIRVASEGGSPRRGRGM